ncbi:MAG: sugar-transfer associated ATP-grasp domain-containing protein [Pseudomonadota bacterium]
MDQALPAKALLAAPRDPAPASAQTTVQVARKHGVSPVRQLREMWALKRGPGKLDSHEYHSSGVFDPAMDMGEKRTFVGVIGSYNINVRLSPPKLTETRAFVRDKVMYTALLQQLGLPTTHTQAVVHTHRAFGNLTVLRDADAVSQFLRSQARYPLFAKPCEGAASVGSALITARDGEMLHLGNGRQVDLAGFAAEIVEDYPEGFILQDALDQHPALTEIAGPAVGTMRVVTVRDAGGADVLYTVWKVPSPSAMSDNFWQSGSMVAEVDADGIVGRCKTGTGLGAAWIEAHPASHRAFAGLKVPHWDAIRDIATRGHMLFPEFGIVGWDIAVGADGPVIIECNDNPYHVLYQLATGRGMLNAQMVPRLDAAAAESTRILDGKVATFRARERAKAAKIW